MAEGDLRWKYNVGTKVKSEIVVDSNGNVFFGSSDGYKLIALNPDGTLKWEYLLVCGPDGGLALSNDESVVYVCDSGCDIYAIYTVDGTEKWSYGLMHGDDEDPGISGIVVDENDNIYVGGWSSAHSLYSINSGGIFRWKIAGNSSHSGLAIGKGNTVVYYQNEYNGLREVQLSDGTINWGHQGVSWGSDGTGISIASDGTIHYGDWDYFYAVNPDGTQKWKFLVSSYPGTNNAVGSNGNIWFVDRNPGTVIVVNPSGSEVWRYDLPSWVGSGYAATGLGLDSNDIVFVGCNDHKLYAINPNGTLRWTYTAGNGIKSGIAFSPNEDTVYFGCEDGYLYAIEKIPSAPTCGIVAVGDKVLLCPIGNQHGNMVALKSGNASLTDKALIASLNNQAALKLDFRNCKSKQGDKIICVPISGTKKNILGLR